MFKGERPYNQEQTVEQVADFLASMVVKAAKGEISDPEFQQAITAAKDVVRKARDGIIEGEKENVN